MPTTRSTLCFCALSAAALSGAAGEFFVLSSVALGPDYGGSLVPSAGSFITQLPQPNAENAYLTELNIAVTPASDVWEYELDYVMASTWLALDPIGPSGKDGNAPYGTGWAVFSGPPGNQIHHPEFTWCLATPTGSGLAVNGTLGDPVNGDGRSPGFFGGAAGFAWGPSEHDNFQAHSQPSMVNGTVIDSMFIGHFVLTSAAANITGSKLLLGISNASPGPEAGTINLLPLDGSPGISFEDFIPGPEIPFHVASERVTFTTAIGTFTAVDLYIVSSGPYPIIDSSDDPDDPPDDDDDSSDDDSGDDEGDNPPSPPPPPPPPSPPAPPSGNPGTTPITSLALMLRTGDATETRTLGLLMNAGFDPNRYSPKQWKKLMKGLYTHRLAPALAPAPSKAERKASLRLLTNAYNYAPSPIDDLTDTGTNDANDDGDVDFADVARILEATDRDPSRLADALSAIGLDPSAFERKKHWRIAIKTFYNDSILPTFAADRSRKDQKRDRKALFRLY